MEKKEILKIRKARDITLFVLAFVFIIIGSLLVFNIFGITDFLKEK